MGRVEPPRCFMNVTFYSFDKKRNSTKVPTGGTQVAVTLKEPCGFLNPSLKLTLDTFNFEWNYCYIPDFSRYYYVEETTLLARNLCQVDLSVDALGSFRAEILASSQYVLRAAQGYDEDIIDMMYPAKAGRKCDFKEIGIKPVINQYTSGTYVLGAIGKSNGYAGVPVTYYILPYSEMLKLNGFLFNSGSYGSMISDDVIKAFFNPMDFIVSCMYIPYTIPTSTLNKVNIDFGWFSTTDIDAYIMQSYTYYPTDLTTRLQIFKPGEGYLNAPPWVQYQLRYPGGYFDIPAEKLYNYEWLDFDISVDIVTGLMNVNVRGWNSAEDNDTVARFAFQYGCPIAIAQLRSDYMSAISSVGAAIGGVLKADAFSATSAVASAIDAITPDPDTRGSNGGLGSAFFELSIQLYTWYFECTEQNVQRLGRPVCAQKTLSSLSGYALCKEAVVEADRAYQSEMDTIEGTLNGGVYIE